MSVYDEPMKIAYLLLAHDNPRHLGRLVRVLASDSAHFFVHVDKKADIGDFQHLAAPNVTFVKPRVAVYWGDYSMIDAQIAVLRQALAATPKYDRFVLLSGTSYPIRPTQWIEDFFARHRAVELWHYSEMIAPKFTQSGGRLTHYKPRADKLLVRLVLKVGGREGKLKRLVGRVLRAVGVLPQSRNYRDYFDLQKPYVGEQWGAFTRAAGQYILDFVMDERNRKFLEFYKNTFAPDEMCFQTILGNSKFKSALIEGSIIYTDWEFEDSPHPKPLTEAHIALFGEYLRSDTDYTVIDPPKLFARKFDDRAEKLVDMLDEVLRDAENR